MNLTSATDTATQGLDRAARGTQRVLESLADTVEHTSQQAADHAATMLRQGSEAVRRGHKELRMQTQHASKAAARQIRNAPLKSVLIAAAAGALVMGLGMLASRSRRASDR